jgi:hypothetical protein
MPNKKLTIREVALQGLKAARTLLKKQGAWMQKRFAKDQFGFDCESTSEEAVCFCASGALRRVLPGDANDKAFNKATKALDIAAGRDIVSFNDDQDTTQARVVRVFGQAIKLLEVQKR